MKTFALMGIAVAFASWTSSAIGQTPEPQDTLNIGCDGKATYVVPNLDYDKEKHRYGDDDTVSTAGRVRVRVAGNSVSVRLPSTLPGGDGWREAERVVVDTNQISGRIKMGLIGRATFTVDRRTGDIDINGGGIRFNGRCEKGPDDSAPAKF